ncbi:MAG TPA: helix-turn-helix domain-containing protein [Gemmatimonadaceae bacterium]
MFRTMMAPSSAALGPYVWAYCMNTGRVDAVPLVIPLPPRPKQTITFSFADRYGAIRPGSGQTVATPRVVVVGPQSCARPGLSVLGRIDNFSILFQPSGFHRLFGVPMTELADAAYDAHAVIGSRLPSVEQELGDAADFSERIQVIERRLIALLSRNERPDAVAAAANRLFVRHGGQRISSMASECGLSLRQFERRFVAQVGVPAKFYARVTRFNAALDQKLRHPDRAWSRIASDHHYHDQMHLVHDCRALTGESPTGLLTRLNAEPAFHPFFATADRPRHV